jgi:phosphate transport system permease protein
MELLYYLTVALIGFYAAKFKILFLAKKQNYKITSTTNYYSYIALMWSIIIFIILITILSIASQTYKIQLPSHSFLLLYSICLSLTVAIIKPKIAARKHFEGLSTIFFSLATNLTLALSAVIVMVIFTNSWYFFTQIPIANFLFGTHWNPQNSEVLNLRSVSFGLLPLLSGTMLITIISLLVAIPFGLTSAIYIAEFGSKKFKSIAKTNIELLAGIPTVVYGYFAAIIVGPLVRKFGENIGLEVASESALAAGIVMGIMITPYIMSLSEDVISSVPKSLKEAALALGFTKTETTIHVVLPLAAPGILAAILLATSRAIGETMIVTMAAGLSANMTSNPLESVTTITVQIVSLLMGDQEFGSISTQSAFALALTLFLATLLLNIFSSLMINKYRKNYE